MAIERTTTIKSYDFDQSIIGRIDATRTFTTALKAGFTPAKYNCVAIDGTDDSLVLYDAGNENHIPVGIVYFYETGNMTVITEAKNVDINKLSIANLAANREAASRLLRTIDIKII